MDRIFLAVNAKINLSLDVVGIRQDNYHALDMCVASVGIADQLEISRCECIKVNMDGKKCGAENIAYRTADECIKAGIIDGLDIKITKGIPMSSGMGGSSADCAGVLFAVQKLTGCDSAVLLKIAEKLASDAVFMYHGGIARATGKGDNLQFLPYKKLYLTIAKNSTGALTKDVFKQFDRENGQATSFTERCISSLDGENISIGNALTDAAIAVDYGIKQTLEVLKNYSNKVCMTGSGSACFAIFDSLQEAEVCRAAIVDKINFVVVATTCNSGIEIIKR